MGFLAVLLIASMILLTVIITATYCTYGPFWSLPSLFLTGRSAAVGLASINSLANLGGFVGPFGFGALQDTTGNNTWGLIIVALILLMAAALVIGARFVRNAETLAKAAASKEI